MRGIIIAFLTICMCSPVAAQGVTLIPDLSRLRPIEKVDVLNRMNDIYADTLVFLAAEFPADHDRLLESLAELSERRGTRQGQMLRAFGELTELRQKYAARLRFAPTEAHARLLGHLAVFYNEVFKLEGPEVCGRFARDGSGVLFERDVESKFATLLDQQAVAYFEAVAQAIETPEVSEPVLEEDWAVIFEYMIAAGVPPEFAKAIGGNDPGDPNLCPALGAMMLVSSTLATPEGERTRADFARNLTGY